MSDLFRQVWWFLCKPPRFLLHFPSQCVVPLVHRGRFCRLCIPRKLKCVAAFVSRHCSACHEFNRRRWSPVNQRWSRGLFHQSWWWCWRLWILRRCWRWTTGWLPASSCCLCLSTSPVSNPFAEPSDINVSTLKFVDKTWSWSSSWLLSSFFHLNFCLPYLSSSFFLILSSFLRTYRWKCG